jgi:hypothetical protein
MTEHSLPMCCEKSANGRRQRTFATGVLLERETSKVRRTSSDTVCIDYANGRYSE